MNSYISSPSKTAALLKRYNIRLKKAYGQNFLIDTNILKKIANYAQINESDHILEVGSGIGSLTEVMLSRGPEIICIEIDKRIIKIFREIFDSQFGDKVTLIEQDALKLNYEDISNKFAINKFVSNLPYKIAAPLILKVFCQAPSVSKAYLTIQKILLIVLRLPVEIKITALIQ
ncbi:MAG: rRNA adenine dimethyltransferase family protein [Actinomycetota bacterium]|nr:rRNA adenine dimethyltransferase family protein [Actinomycetota bacterium]